MPKQTRIKKGKPKPKGQALKALLRELNSKHSKKRPWKCTECKVMNVGDHCQNCGRNFYGRPDNEIPAAKDKLARPGLRDDVSQGFTSYEP